MEVKPVVIGCDNAAFHLKHDIMVLLKDKNIAFEDVGIHSADEQTIYPLIAQRVADAIIASGYRKDGILLCGTGIGMAISANKFPGIYAAVCHDIYSAERARLSNNANVITLGARVIGPELAKKVVAEWLRLEYQDGPSTQKLSKIQDFERSNFRVSGEKS